MGAYSSSRDGSSTDDSTDEQPDERDADQSGLDDYDEPKEDTSNNDDPSGTPVSGVSAPAAPVVEEPPEDESSESESDNGEEPEDSEVEEPDDVDKQEPEDEHESEEEDDDEDEEDETVTVTITVDPLSAMSWGIQPVIMRVKETYGDQVEFEYQVAPVRIFHDPETMREKWEASTDLHDMPVDLSFWEDPPDSTELVNRALVAATKQGATETYLRALWIEGIAGGQNLSKEVALDSLASRMGLDVDKFQSDMEYAELDTDLEQDELPVTEVPIKGYTQTWPGNVHYADFKQQFIFEGLVEGRPQRLDGFIDEHGPVATEEVMGVYQWDRDNAVKELRERDGLYSMNIGEGTFWFTK